MKSKIKKNNHNNLNQFYKIVIRICLLSTFFILSTMLSIIFISWIDLLYYENKGINKSPLFDAYVIVSDSMLPTIKINDAVIVTRVKDNSLNIGDVITFCSSDYYFDGLTITHRVIDKKLGEDGNYLYKTKGDNNELGDASMVENSEIYGKAIMKIPKVGYIYNFVSSPTGFLFSVILPVLLIVCYETWRINKVCKERYKDVEIL